MTMRIQIDAGGAGEVKADTVVIPITRRGDKPKALPQGLSGLDRRMGGRLSDTLASGDFGAGVGCKAVRPENLRLTSPAAAAAVESPHPPGTCT